MDIKQILKLLYEVSVSKGLSHPFICGGVPRDRILGIINSHFNDIDITTGSNDVSQLAKEFSIVLKNKIPLITKQNNDGHISIFMKDLKIDFSSNFKIPNISNILLNKNIEPTELMQELYSRDFFCNTLLMSLDFRKIKDLTGEAIKDINNKLIRTCLSPDLTFRYNTNRIIRVLYLAAKLDFEVSEDIIEWVNKNPTFILKSTSEYNAKNIDKALLKNPIKTIELINKMNIWKYIPITKNLIPYFNRIIE